MDSMKLKAIPGTEKHLAITLISVSSGQNSHYTLVAKNTSPGAPLGCSAEGQGLERAQQGWKGPEVRHGHGRPCEGPVPHWGPVGPGLGLVSTAAHLALSILKNRQTENKAENKMKSILRWELF